MRSILLTGGAGFFGSILKRKCLEAGYSCVSIDLQYDDFTHPNFRAVQGDIRDNAAMDKAFEGESFAAIFHCAAMLAHAVKDTTMLWSSNVDGTENVAEYAEKHQVPTIVFTSSNCLWGKNMERPVTEEDAPEPVELYGRSKWEGEKILQKHADKVNSVIIRCPTIIDSGRLGLLAILFEFIDEGRKVWVVGGGKNVYQFIYAEDLADAFLKSVDYKQTTVFNIGSDNVKSFKEVYQYLINRAGTKARVATLPRGPTIFAMKVAYALGLSPLGPYHYKMIAESFVFDTTKIKRELGWQPTLTNEEMMTKAYEYYHQNRKEIESRTDVSAHKQAAKMGIIRLLKWLS